MNESVESVRGADAIAIERTLAGDRDAYRVLVERHSATIFRLAYRLTGNHHDAEEIVQEAFLRAYQKLEQFASQANFATWYIASRRTTPSIACDSTKWKRRANILRSRGCPATLSRILCFKWPMLRRLRAADAKRGVAKRHGSCAGNLDASRTNRICNAALRRLRD